MFPPFFCVNPDALEAFNKHGVAHIEDLSIELMYNFVYQDLHPKLLSKAVLNGLFDDDGTERQNDNASACASNNAIQTLVLDLMPMTVK